VSQRTYELLYIVAPTVGEAEVETLTTQIKGYVEEAGGEIEKVEPWGKKRLAYLIGNQRDGNYVLITYKAVSTTVHQVERRMKVTDDVLKFMTVRIDEALRKAESRRARRAAKESRRKGRQASRGAAAGGAS